MITRGPEFKIHINDVVGAISIELHGLVLAKKFTSVPKDIPSIAPWIGDIETEINHTFSPASKSLLIIDFWADEDQK